MLLVPMLPGHKQLVRVLLQVLLLVVPCGTNRSGACAGGAARAGATRAVLVLFSSNGCRQSVVPGAW